MLLLVREVVGRGGEGSLGQPVHRAQAPAKERMLACWFPCRLGEGYGCRWLLS